MDLGLTGRVALVTGGSSGLGLAAATALAGEGARVALASRSKDNLERAATSIHAATGRDVETFVADVSDLEAIPALVTAARDRLGPIAILVANAGGPSPGKFADLDRAAFDRAYRLTLMSTVELCRAVLPDMTAKGSGRIVAITSTTVRQPIDGLILSNTFRAGLTGFLKTLSREVGPNGITVNSVAPGYVETERLAELKEHAATTSGRSIDDVEASWAASTALGHLGEPRDIGDAIAWLCSENAGYITGQVMVVDGGRVLGL
jgi:3-oxoacyl-[acyl-carrier protein] reductase